MSTERSEGAHSPDDWFSPENMAAFEAKLQRYMFLPAFSDLKEQNAAAYDEIDEKTSTTKHPKANEIRDVMKDKVGSMLDESNYAGALALIDNALTEGITSLPKEDQVAARRRLLFRKAHIYEHQGTNGYKGLSVDDPKRQAAFLRAANIWTRI